MPLVLVALLAVLWLLVADHRERLGLSRLSARGALVIAFLVFELLLLAVTEVTSVGHHFTTGVVSVAWGLLLVVLMLVARARLARLLRGVAAGGRHKELRGQLQSLGNENAVWVLVILAAFAILAAIGWLYPPNNGDSLVYHLTRVEHWIQNQSVAAYATHYLAQIELAPLHEYNLANLHLLFGSDRLDGYVQLLAALVCVVGVSEMARLLGGSRRVQAVAAILCVTIPSGILEATSTENNYFAAAIGVALLVLLLSWTGGGRWIPRVVGIGLAGGLVVMAKGTLLALIGPVVLVLAVLALRTEWRTSGGPKAVRTAVASGLIGLLCAAAVAAPFLWQNVQLFGGPLGPVSKSTVSTNLTPKAALANVIRSTAGDFLIGGGPGGIESDVSRLALTPLQALFSRLDVSPSDQNYALGTDFAAFTVRDKSLTARLEDFGANPWHVILILLTTAALVVAVVRGRHDWRIPLLIALGLCCGFVLFTATARWSVFNVRYQVPLLVAWCPLIALMLGLLHRLAGRLVLVALVVACTPQLLDNAARSLVHPSYNFSSTLAPYFPNVGPAAAVSSGADSYESLTSAIAESSCREVSLANWVVVEYPLWVGLHDDGWTGRIEDVGVMNASHRLETPGYRACASIRQEGSEYVSPDDGTVNLQYGALALSVNTPEAATIMSRVPGFTSRVDGVRILPGGGWSLGGNGGPTVQRSGSMYVFSGGARHVWVVMRTAASQTPPAVLEGTSSPIPATTGPGFVEFSLDLTSGVTPVHLLTPAGSAPASLTFTEVAVVAAPVTVGAG